jgi:hypothetical protein
MYPLLKGDISLAVAALRIICNFIYDDEDYQDFKTEHHDKALLFAMTLTHIQSTEVAQVFFDMVTQSNHFATVTSSSSLSTEINEKIKRVEILKLLVDLASIAFPNISLCRTILEWLRQLVSHSKENLFVYAKFAGFLPLQIIISGWTIIDFSSIPLKAADASFTVAGSNLANSFTELEKKRVSFLDYSSTTGGSSEIAPKSYPSRHESIVSTATTQSYNTNTSGGSGNSNEEVYKPVDVSSRGVLNVAGLQGNSRPTSLTIDHHTRDSVNHFVSMYKVHVSALLLFRTLLVKLFTENQLEVYSKTMNEPAEVINLMLLNVLSFVVSCSRWVFSMFVDLTILFYLCFY